MPHLLCLVYAALAGIVQGVTEWLPISSTGHLILLESVFGAKLEASVMTPQFSEMFDVVIQFGSIMAIVVIYFKRLDPFSPSKSKEERRETLTLWKNIIIAALPAGVVGLLSDDKLSATVFREPQVRYVIAGALLFYGIWFIVIERKNTGRTYKTVSPEKIGTKTALGIGVFQVLALIPGTSRSGSTIIGSSALGVSRTASAEFSFFVAVPVMLGASSLKIVKFASSGASFTLLQFSVLATGTLVAFLVSLATVKFLVGFVRRHSFEGFGWYRIALALAVTVYFAFIIK